MHSFCSLMLYCYLFNIFKVYTYFVLNNIFFAKFFVTLIIVYEHVVFLVYSPDQ